MRMAKSLDLKCPLCEEFCLNKQVLIVHAKKVHGKEIDVDDLVNRALTDVGFVSCRICFALMEREYCLITQHTERVHSMSKNQYVAEFGPDAFQATDEDLNITEALKNVKCPRCEYVKVSGLRRLQRHYQDFHSVKVTWIGKILRELKIPQMVSCQTCLNSMAKEKLGEHAKLCRSEIYLGMKYYGEKVKVKEEVVDQNLKESPMDEATDGKSPSTKDAPMESTNVKRKRGRPRKENSQVAPKKVSEKRPRENSQIAPTTMSGKRPRGRPRKLVADASNKSVSDAALKKVCVVLHKVDGGKSKVHVEDFGSSSALLNRKLLKRCSTESSIAESHRKPATNSMDSRGKQENYLRKTVIQDESDFRKEKSPANPTFRSRSLELSDKNGNSELSKRSLEKNTINAAAAIKEGPAKTCSAKTITAQARPVKKESNSDMPTLSRRTLLTASITGPTSLPFETAEMQLPSNERAVSHSSNETGNVNATLSDDGSTKQSSNLPTLQTGASFSKSGNISKISKEDFTPDHKTPVDTRCEYTCPSCRLSGFSSLRLISEHIQRQHDGVLSIFQSVKQERKVKMTDCKLCGIEIEADEVELGHHVWSFHSLPLMAYENLA